MTARELRLALLGRDGEALATLLAASGEDLASSLCLHARTEAVRLLPVAVAGPISTCTHGEADLDFSRGYGEAKDGANYESRRPGVKFRGGNGPGDASPRRPRWASIRPGGPALPDLAAKTQCCW